MRILLVEDNETLADGLSAILRGSGYAVDVVRDGASADAVTATESFDLSSSISICRRWKVWKCCDPCGRGRIGPRC